MADPEQIYTEVLQEEQGKGVSPAVAEGRAKAARVRAEQGSPHPKEPKWWPGAQPHLEGDGAAPSAPAEETPAEEEAPAEPAAAETPAAPPAAPEAPAPAEAPPPAPEPAPAATAPAPEQPAAPTPEQPAAPAPAAPAPQPAAAATATSLPPEQRPAGVMHGVPTGTRLRPEDAVQTDAQFEGQQAVYERRRLIDDVVATQGPPPAPAGPRSGQWALFLVYLAVVAGAIFFVVGQSDLPEAGGEREAPPGGGGPAVTAENVAFDTESLELPAGESTQLEFHNEDASSVTHNIAIYEDDSVNNALFQGETIPGGQSVTYEIPPLDKGTYYLQCDVHPGMNGEVKVQ